MNSSALFIAVFLACVVEAVEATTIVPAAGSTRDWRSALSGVAGGLVTLAVIAALSAVVVVVVLGVAVRAPLARVPENAMKFAVGVMLTAFGAFWGVEGAGSTWPGSDAALLVLVPAIAAFGLLLVAILRRRRSAPASAAAPLGTSVTA